MSDYKNEAFDREAPDYEQRWESYLNHTHSEFLQHIKTTPRDTVLDVSGGTGLLAKLLVEQGYSFDHLVVNDLSEEMLAIARKRLTDKPNISFSNYKANELPFEESHFDKIFCLNAFHFYHNQQQVLEDFYTLLKPGGQLYLLDWNRTGFFKIVNQFITWSTIQYINTRPLSKLERMLQKSGFTIQTSDQWNWRYWKFLYIKAGK